MNESQEWDVVVIGGGPAGLQATLTLGRMHRRVLTFDAGAYRNDPADRMHNFATHDDRSPTEFRALARADLARYDTVTVRDQAVTGVQPDPSGGGFVVHTLTGSERTRRVLLATGVRDTLPPIPGLPELFGTIAAHCPFCHGHEYADHVVAVLGTGPHVAMQARMMGRIAAKIIVLTNGGELDPDTAGRIGEFDIEVDDRPLVGMRRSAPGATISFNDGPDLEVGGMLVATTFRQTTSFAADLGLSLLPSGCVEIDPMGRTSMPGIYAAGDCAHVAALGMPLSSVLASAAAGQSAAGACIGDELFA